MHMSTASICKIVTDKENITIGMKFEVAYDSLSLLRSTLPLERYVAKILDFLFQKRTPF